MRPATTFDELELEQPVLHFFRALALKQTLRVRFAANGEQLDLRALEVEAFASDPWSVAS
ncbi:MAG TPA: hypothetical protein VL326_02180 [Kofleriaceae bacterium]|jgi:hypothetical protein|nr:hypothetical protein [Kofleriaceae bacterium]